jgi:hypothetical protein
MRLSVLAASVVACLAGPATMAQPFEDLFDYQEPRRPRGGDCEQIAAAIGADATWRGDFSGRRWEDFNEQSYPFGLQGCFESELACRIWQQAGHDLRRPGRRQRHELPAGEG